MSWDDRVRRGKILLALIIAGIVGILAIIGYYGIKDMLEADMKVHFSAIALIISVVIWVSVMRLFQYFIMKSKYRKYWNLWDIGKPDP